MSKTIKTNCAKLESKIRKLLKEKLELGKDLDNLKHDIREYLKINQELLYENEYLRQKLGIPITEEIVEDVIKNFSEQIRHR